MAYKKCSGHPDVRCECGGQLMIDGEGWVELPFGFGFSDKGKFVVDVARYSTYRGYCEKCRHKGTFIRSDQKPKPVRKTPRGINQKIASVAP